MSKTLSNGMVISLEQSKRLIALEEIISTGLNAFRDVAAALAEINNSKLYLVEFDTFEQYCKTKWGMGKRYAYQQIEAHETLQLLEKQGIDVSNCSHESQVRALKSAPAEQRAEILKSVARAGKVTAKAIRQEIAKRKPAPEPIVKPSRVINCEPVEQTFVMDQETPIERGPVDLAIAQIRAIADDMEEDYAMPAPGEELDCEKYAERLQELARLVRKLKGVTV